MKQTRLLRNSKAFTKEPCCLQYNNLLFDKIIEMWGREGEGGVVGAWEGSMVRAGGGAGGGWPTPPEDGKGGGRTERLPPELVTGRCEFQRTASFVPFHPNDAEFNLPMGPRGLGAAEAGSGPELQDPLAPDNVGMAARPAPQKKTTSNKSRG